VAIIDAPFALPLKGQTRIQVTNWGAHDPWSARCSSWPSNLLPTLKKKFGNHPVGFCDARNQTLEGYKDLRSRLITGVHRKTDLLRHCLKMDDWDFFFGVFSESHCVGHQCWHLMDEHHPLHDPHAPAELRTAIRDVYQAIDEGIATILNELPNDTHVLVVLTHGMGPYYSGTHLLDAILWRLGMNDQRGTNVFRSRMWESRRFIPERVRTRLRRAILMRTQWDPYNWCLPKLMQWPRSRAFNLYSNNMTAGIRINLKGRDPAGMVEPGVEYDRLCDRLRQSFLALKNPDTGQAAVQWVARASDLYHGSHMHEFPDLFIEWDHSQPINALVSPEIGRIEGVFQESRTGDHRVGGLLLGQGDQFLCAPVDTRMRTVDLAPTILDFFGVKTPTHCEGHSVLPALRSSVAQQMRSLRP
jgi:predicted AlkP superfamily phosphohydrolase/phosphomutase